jgi:hypothetical protein
MSAVRPSRARIRHCCEGQSDSPFQHRQADRTEPLLRNVRLASRGTCTRPSPQGSPPVHTSITQPHRQPGSNDRRCQLPRLGSHQRHRRTCRRHPRPAPTGRELEHRNWSKLAWVLAVLYVAPPLAGYPIPVGAIAAIWRTRRRSDTSTAPGLPRADGSPDWPLPWGTK